MATVVRRCATCGRLDTRQSWSSMDSALKAGAMGGSWTCPSCAGLECDLEEVERTPEELRQDELVRAGQHPDSR